MSFASSSPLQVKLQAEIKCPNVTCQRREVIKQPPIALLPPGKKIHGKTTVRELLATALQRQNQVTNGSLRVTDLKLLQRASVHLPNEPAKGGDLHSLLDNSVHQHQDELWTLQKIQENVAFCSPNCQSPSSQPDLISDISPADDFTMHISDVPSVTPFNTRDFTLPLHQELPGDQPAPLTINPDEIPIGFAPTPPGYSHNSAISSTEYIAPTIPSSRQSSMNRGPFTSRPLPSTPTPGLNPEPSQVSTSGARNLPGTKISDLSRTPSIVSQMSATTIGTQPQVNISRTHSTCSSTAPSVHPPAVPQNINPPLLPEKQNIKFSKLLSDEDFQTQAKGYKEERPYILTLLKGGNMIEVTALKKKKMSTKVVRFQIIMVRDQRKDGGYGYTINYEFIARNMNELLRYYKERPLLIDGMKIRLQTILYPKTNEPQ